MGNLTVKKIVRKYLEENGYDGLVNTGLPCSCLSNDLMPCVGEWDLIEYCQAGYKVPCKPNECEVGGCDWHVALEKANE